MTRNTLDDDRDARYRALLALAALPATGETLPELLARFAVGLAPAVHFDECLAVTLAAEDGVPRVVAAPGALEGERAEALAVETVVVPEPDIQALSDRPGAVILDELAPEGPFPALAASLLGRGHRSACLVPLGAGMGPVGFICLASQRPAAFAGADAGFLEHAARLFALAAERQENRLRLERRERELEADRGHWRTLLEVSNAVVGTLDLEALRAAIAVSMRRIVAYELINLLLLDSDGQRIGLFSLDPGVPAGLDDAVDLIRIEDTPFGDPRNLRTPLVCEPEQMTFLPDVIFRHAGFRSMRRFCILPLATPRGTLGAIALSSASDDAFGPGEVEHAAQAAGQVAIAIENAMAFQEIAALKDRLAQENLYLADEIRGWSGFEDIVGESAALQRVLAQVRSVADTDTTVLLLGETGTGKELFARALHNLSARKSHTLVAVNCATSPAGLLESEWFGYEKGAFTGALARKAGRFEVADRGTLFLDEVGDIPLDLQAKLLRVLQEHEIERVGATRPVRVDFRLVAATNADLQSLVNDRKFRSDLFYRLNVFPIRIPPLRERVDDIPPLVTYFTQRYAKRLRRQVDSVPRETMDALCRWPWPGNVRELQNVIERAVILSPGRTLQIPPTEFAGPAVVGGTLESAEREHILKALVDTNWVVGGRNGAAARLGLKRTTLASTMKRLGIERPASR